jgi:hypothetical protein
VTKVRLKYLHCFNDRHGRARYYFRYRGQQWPIPAPGTEGFATAYDGLLAHIRANPFRSRASVEYMPGSLAWAIEQFLASPLYNERAETTRRNYRRVLDQLRESYGPGLLRDLQPRHVRKIRNDIAAKSTTGADIAMSLISALWEFATDRHLPMSISRMSRGADRRRNCSRGMRQGDCGAIRSQDLLRRPPGGPKYGTEVFGL